MELRHSSQRLRLNSRQQFRCFATKFSGRVVVEAENGRSFAVEVDTPTLQADSRGYALPRRDLICKISQILKSPPSPSSDPFLDLSDYLDTLSLTLTPSEASEILKSVKSPNLALRFFRFCPSGVPKFRHDCFTYNRILLILSKASLPNRLDCVREIVDEMEKSGIRGNISTVNLLIGTFGDGEFKGNGVDELKRCLGLVQKWELRLNCYSYKCLLQAYIRLGNYDKALGVYEEMRRRGYRLDIFAYNMLLDALAREQKVDQVNKVFEDMKKWHCEPDEYTYTILIRMTGKLGKPGESLSFFQEMLSKEGKLRRLDEVVELSKRYMNKSIYAYLVRTLSKLGHASEAHRLFCNMWSFHDRGDRDAYLSMLESLCNAKKVTEAIDLLNKMNEKGVKADAFMYNTVFSALGKLKQISHLHDLYEKMKQDGPSPDIFTYNILISSFGRAGEVEEALKIFEELENSNCKPDIVSYNSLINCLGKNGDIDEAHVKFIEMQEKGLNPDVVTYSTLIECFGKTEKVEMARRLFDEMVAAGCYPNIVTYNILLDCLEKSGRTSEAVSLYAKLKEQGLTADSITYTILERIQSGSHRTSRVRRQNPITGWVVSPLR